MIENPNTLIVHVDAEIQDLVPDFLAHRRHDLETLEAAVDRGDLEQLQDIGHNLKGVGGGFGFDGISEIGRELEAAARAGNLDGIRRAVAALRAYLEQVEIVIEPGSC